MSPEDEWLEGGGHFMFPSPLIRSLESLNDQMKELKPGRSHPRTHYKVGGDMKSVYQGSASSMLMASSAWARSRGPGIASTFKVCLEKKK